MVRQVHNEVLGVRGQGAGGGEATSRVQIKIHVYSGIFCAFATIYVPREVAAGDEITGRRFDVRDAIGARVDYTGMMVKRGALTASDYQAVAPHTVHLNTIDITPSYAFKKGKHDYEIGYEGPWLPDTAQLEAVRYSPAKPVKFSFSK